MKKKSCFSKFLFRDYIKIVSLFLMSFMASSSVFSQQTLRTYLIGNSVTDAINYNGLKALAESRGNTHIWARQMIPGSPLSWLWEHPADGFVEQPYGYPSNAFVNYDWDAISLQPFDRQVEGSGNDLEMFGNYINLSKTRSPNAQYYVYMRWPRMPNSRNSLAECTECTADAFTNTWSRTYTGGYDGTNETKDFFEDLLLAVRAANFTSKQPLIVPVGEVFNNLNTKMKNGQIAGYSSIWQVYSDGIHMTGIGSYIAAVTYFSTLYKADPRGLGVPSDFGTINSSLATAIQNAVWEVVSTYQYSGVSTGVAVTGVSASPTSLSLSPGQSGQITATVSPANATNKSVNWSSSNTSVATVNSTGQVSALAVGTATITATTSDGNRTATTTVTVSSASGGLNYQFYTGTWDLLPNFSTLTPSKTGTVANFDLTPRTQNDNFAFRFTGNIQIATAGAYTFYTTSDDGSKLYINGTQVVNNDGLHGMVEASGAITLTAGTHNIEVTVFERTGGEGLEVRYQGPGIAKQLIPNSAFSNSIAVTSVSLNRTSASTMVGKNFQLTATVSPANATNKVVSWTSSNTSVATVDNTGLVTGVAAGTANITATTADGNRTAVCAVTVFANSKPTAVLNASVTSGNAPLAVNFNANGSSDPNAGDFILGYEWNFGDGSAISNANAPSKTYTAAGSYTVTLRVMDNNNLYSDPVTRVINVTTGSTGGTSGVLASWDFTAKGGSTTVASTASSADVTGANASLGSGLTAISYLGNGLTATNQTSVTLAEALSGNEYLSFTVAPASGKTISINKFELRGISQGFNRTFTLFSSKNGFSAGNAIASFTNASEFSSTLASINISNHDNLTTSTEFRVYIYGRNNQYESVGTGNRNGASGTYDVAISGSSSNSSVITGSVVRETWTGISGNSVSLIPTSTAPNNTANLTSLEIPIDNADNYGTRIRGYIIPSTSGSYTFYVSGDDDVQLWLSTNSDPLNKAKIAEIIGWTNTREWNKYPSQTSTARTLTAGTQYYFEVLHKEGNGGDNLAVGWTGPGISTISVIGGSNISQFNGGTTPPPADTQAPSVPSGLSSASVAQTSFTLNWGASTDNVGVTGYEVFRNGTSIGTPSSNSFNVTGLSASTAYSMTVRARDAAGNWSAQSTPFSVTTSATPPPSGTPKLPIGMNINSTSYYTKGLIFTDVMCTASSMFTFYDNGPWNSEQINNIPRDVNGYPTQLPYNVGGQNQKVRFLINNYYSGRYVMLYDGVGQFNISGAQTTVINGKTYIDFTGQDGYIWIDINQSQLGNHIRNIRIIPQQYENGSPYPTFLSKFVDGLRPFHALRFMDWTATNNSPQKNWSDRCTKTYYSQCTDKGMSLDYAIELANLLNVGGWFCIPHLASDDYHRQMARFIRDNLNPNLKVYIEYSNEIWNWQFSQAGWIVNNAPGSVDSYVSTDLAALGAAGSNHPEKDAYMIARAFRLFKGEFTGANASRLVKIGAVQHGWVDNTRRVLEFLKNANQQCDWVSPGGYFNFGEGDHNNWLQRCTAVTPAEVVTAASNYYNTNEAVWTDETAAYANQYGVGYAVYEGGQHMQPYLQGEWCYNQAVWDAQIHPSMYDLYMKNFTKHIQPNVNCQLFMAFSYVGERQSRYGSWGHLESLDQVGSTNMRTIAPKYQALLDANAPKSGSRQGVNEGTSNTNYIDVFPNPTENGSVTISSNIDGEVVVVNAMGVVVFSGVTTNGTLNVNNLSSGLYIVKSKAGNAKMIVK